MRSGAVALILVASLALAACGSSAKKSTSSTAKSTAQQPGAAATRALVATLTAPNHAPKVNQNWPITVTAHDRAGRPVRAHVQYLFLFNGAVVAKRSNYAFTGVFHDNITWPANSVGLPLAFRALVTSAIGTKALDYPVRVSR
jgi:hypothetical protein